MSVNGLLNPAVHVVVVRCGFDLIALLLGRHRIGGDGFAPKNWKQVVFVTPLKCKSNRYARKILLGGRGKFSEGGKNNSILRYERKLPRRGMPIPFTRDNSP